MISKLPQDLRLVVSHKIKNDKWNLEEVMEVIEHEIGARERAGVSAGITLPSSGAPKKASKELHTAAALLSSELSMACVYCGQSHSANSCRTVTSVDSRRQILMKAGRCFMCLKRFHKSRDCRSGAKCSACQGRHHSSVCNRNPSIPCQGATPAPLSASGRENGTSGVQGGSDGSKNTRPSVVSMFVDGQTSVLLQTTRTVMHHPQVPSRSVPVRMILDTGSQRSYLALLVKEALSLDSQCTETMLIKTFGSAVECRRSCNVVRVAVRTKDKGLLELQFLTVPLVCEPLSGQPISYAVERYPHLSNLELADPVHHSSDNMEINVLIGSDQYWQMVTETILRGVSGPTAIETRFGWVLSGPAEGIVNDSTTINLVPSSHVLHLNVSSNQCNFQPVQ